MTLDKVKKGEIFLVNKFIVEGNEKEEYVGLTLGEKVTLTNTITFRGNTFLCLQNDKYGYLIDMYSASNVYGEVVKNKNNFQEMDIQKEKMLIKSK